MIEILKEAAGAVGLMLAIAAYMVAVWIVTEFIKPKLKLSGGKALGLAWGIGGLLYLLLATFRCYAVTWASFFVFIVVTGICTGGYKLRLIKEALDPIRRMGE